MLPTFDLDVLRTFVTGVDAGSFAGAAARVGRSPAAVSAQLRRLEEHAGAPVLRRQGRGLVLTEAGETLLGYARRLLELNDEAVARVRGTTLEGWVRLGMQEDFGESVLPGILARFTRSHPKVRVEARVARNRDLLDRVAAGRLDLALVWGEPPAGMAHQRVARLRMHWIGAGPAMHVPGDSPLPLVAFEGPCCFRAAATDALDRAGIPWRLAFTSASLSGLLAAAAAGLGVTVRTRVGLRTGVRPLGKSAGLPRLPSVALHLVRAADSQSAPAAQLRAILVEAVRPAP